MLSRQILEKILNVKNIKELEDILVKNGFEVEQESLINKAKNYKLFRHDRDQSSMYLAYDVDEKIKLFNEAYNELFELYQKLYCEVLQLYYDFCDGEVRDIFKAIKEIKSKFKNRTYNNENNINLVLETFEEYYYLDGGSISYCRFFKDRESWNKALKIRLLQNNVFDLKEKAIEKQKKLLGI